MSYLVKFQKSWHKRNALVLRWALGSVLLIGLFLAAPATGLAAGVTEPPRLTNSMQIQPRGKDSRFTLNYADGWVLSPSDDDTSILLMYDTYGKQKSAATARYSMSRLLVQTERRSSVEGALQRLQAIAGSRDNAVFYSISGWPAVEIYEITQPDKIGADDRASGKIPLQQRITIAIAVDRNIVRFSGTIMTDEEPQANDAAGGTYLDMRHMAENLGFTRSGNPVITEQQLDTLRAEHRTQQAQRAQSRTRAEKASETVLPPQTGLHAEEFGGEDAEIGLVTNTENGAEIEAIASTDGQTIIVATNSRNYSTSNDGGQTFTQGSITNLGGDVAYDANGDPSLAYGWSGDFYFAFIAYPQGGAGAGDSPAGCTTGVTASTDNGLNFSHRGHARFCPANDPDGAGPLRTCFPDQEHIAADRWNPSGSAEDQVYSAWRDFTPGNNVACRGFGSGSVQSQIVCSTDSGVTWGNTRNLNGDFARVAVGQDGFVYAVTRVGGDPADIEIAKFSSCDTGLVLQDDFPATVYSNSNSIDCPVPGLDRCNDGNDLRSATVAVDDLDPSHIFVAVAQHTTTDDDAGSNPADQVGENENIYVFDSTNGGKNWSGAVTLNPGFAARRYMPWTCTMGGTAYVGWYDRRGANALDNSFTDYYLGSASRTGSGLVKGPEFRVSPTSDANCDAGWGNSSPRSTADSESCTDQPQQAGFCSGAGTRCDFSDVNCPGGETCDTGGGGPKYGDYSGIACAAGRVYAAYASATPPGGPQSTDIDSFLRTDIVCCVPQITVPGDVDFGEVCESGVQTQTLEVCNTGIEDLEIDSIDSSDPAFAANPTSSGWPIVISKDFCFPLEVTYDPAEGDATGTLTFNSNDPVSPALQVAVSADAGTAAIQTFITDAGSFGEVCSGDLHDLNLTIQSNGTCDLEIDGITLSGTDAGDFELPSGSFAGTVIEAGNSLLVPVRFVPTNFTDPSPRTASVDVASSTVGGDSLPLDQTPVTGVVPPPDIQLAMADEGDFGDVCKGGQADLDLTLFNQGKCDLAISNIELVPPGGSFELPTQVTFPLVLSPDADFPFPMRYAPEECDDTPEEAQVKITSDDPDEGEVFVDISGTSPCPQLVIDPAGLEDLYAFPTTVADSSGSLGCYNDRTAVLRNNGACPLTIDNITATGASGDPEDFAVIAPTLFPVILPSGEETLEVAVRFTPQADDNPLAPSEVLGLLTVVSDDPDGDATGDLCGESAAKSGIRVLVTDFSGDVPLVVEGVDNITVQSKGKRTPSPVNLQFTDVDSQSVDVCGNTVTWHIDQETLPAVGTTGSNPKSSYQVSAREGNLADQQSFSLGQCEFRDFQLQFLDSDSDVCTLLPKGDSCDNDGQCCSGNCKGKNGNKSCR
jgi:hypothetical protein